MAPPKAKGQKMGLGEFLTDTSLGSWADEMEDAPIPSGGRGAYSGERSFGTGGVRSDSYAERGYSVRESLPLPSKPPFTVHLGNMSFDATEGDIQDFFVGCQVTHVRIVEDKVDRKPKGFGYVEFATLDGLKKALELNGSQFQGRNIRVSVAEPQKERPDARELNDWTRKGPLPDLGPRRPSDRPAFGGRTPDNASDAGGDRPSRRHAFEQGDGRVRDFSNWERKGPLTPSLPTSTPGPRNLDRPSSHDGPRDRRNSPAWGEGRSQDGSRPPRREFVDRPVVERAPTAAEMDSQWRLKMRPDAVTTTLPTTSPGAEASNLSSPATVAPAIPPISQATRPKLNLQKRTVSQAEPSPALTTGMSDSKASPFGAARPIDTSAREKEIEDKIKQRKEQEDKAREEKRIADEKSKEEKRLAKEAERAEKIDRTKDKANGQTKEGGHGDLQGRSYQILRRDTGDDLGTTEVVEGANGSREDEKTAKVQELVRDTKTSNGMPDEPNNEKLEEEGWSTVSTKSSKTRKAVLPGARGIAS